MIVRPGSWVKSLHESKASHSVSVLFLSLFLFFKMTSISWLGFPGGSVVKNMPADAGDAGDASSVPGLGMSLRGGNSKPR